MTTEEWNDKPTGSNNGRTIIGQTAIDAEKDATIARLTAELEAARERLADWQSSQHYSYIDRNGKRVLARDLESRDEAAEAKLAVAVDALTRIKNYCQNSPISQGEINAGAWAEKALAKITVATS